VGKNKRKVQKIPKTQKKKFASTMGSRRLDFASDLSMGALFLPV